MNSNNSKIFDPQTPDDPLIRIYLNKIENRIPFKIEIRCYFDLFTLEMVMLLGSVKSKITKDETGENVPHLESTAVALVPCNIVRNDYQQDSRVLYTFIPNKSFDQLLDVSDKNFVSLKTFNSEFLYNEVRFTYQNPKPLEIRQTSI